MRIGIVDADLISIKNHRFPNLVCMKLSNYYKKKGHNVELVTDYGLTDKFDKVFISKVFTETVVPQEVLEAENVTYGGTGFYYDKAPSLPYDIEHTMPDYSLYDDFVQMQLQQGTKKTALKYYTDFSIGFTTRGCIRQCSFCVNKNCTSCNLHSPISEFLDKTRKYICLLDDNVFACKEWKHIFAELNASGKRFQFKQGLDERLLTEEKCNVLFQSSWVGEYIFAFDNIKDQKVINEKLKLIKQYTDKIPVFYCFCAYNHSDPDNYNHDFWVKDIGDLFERIRILMGNRSLPYVMRYKSYTESPYKGMYITIARWCNQPQMFKKKSFREFCILNGLNSSSVRYMQSFEAEHTDIAAKYFDMKW